MQQPELLEHTSSNTKLTQMSGARRDRATNDTVDKTTAPGTVRSLFLRDETGVRLPLRDRLQSTFVKPGAPMPVRDEYAQGRDELAASAKSANDKERLIGLLAAPWAAGIGLVIVNTLIAHDPSSVTNGQPNKLYVNVALYHEALIALMVLALAMMVFAWLRKRLLLGMVMALYGLTVFNLRYWGFGIPFVLCGAWLLVRAYRFQRALREADGGETDGFRRPRANKRYTPPN